MDLINNKSCIDIITGPMFSGKTTELIRRLSIFREADMKVLYINSSLDTREFVSHNKCLKLGNIDCCNTYSLMGIVSFAKIFDVIGIDEAQFFEDLVELCVQLAEVHNVKVIVSGLNSDFKRQKFGNICDLLPVSDNITKLYPFCALCAKNKILTPALFSKRTIVSDEKIVIGDIHSYIPTCRECYIKDCN